MAYLDSFKGYDEGIGWSFSLIHAHIVEKGWNPVELWVEGHYGGLVESSAIRLGE